MNIISWVIVSILIALVCLFITLKILDRFLSVKRLKKDNEKLRVELQELKEQEKCKK